MRVLIVDDEPLARRGVAARLKRYPDIEVVGECESGREAVARTLEFSPDLMFLDVQMPDMDGFETLRSLPPDRIPYVIFLTAHEEHAVRAFEVHALDYLLKPISGERFAAALDRARTQTDRANKAELASRMLHLLGKEKAKPEVRFVVKTGSRIHVIEARDIDWISAGGDYAELHVKGAVHLLRETMSLLETKLEPLGFARIHRSRMVNLKRIIELRVEDNGEYTVMLSGGAQLRSSRTCAHKIEAWLHR